MHMFDRDSPAFENTTLSVRPSPEKTHFNKDLDHKEIRDAIFKRQMSQ